MSERDVVERLNDVLSNEEGTHDEAPLGLCEEAAAEIASLRAVVERLPVTADGVRVVPGMELWYLTTDGEITSCGECDPSTDQHATDNEGYSFSLDHCYSTQAAAEAAREGE